MKEMNSEQKIYQLVAITHDGDCSDCSYTPLEIPVNLNLGVAYGEYLRWRGGHISEHKSFEDWLVSEKGAKHPDIEEFEV